MNFLNILIFMVYRISTDQPIIRYHRSQNTAIIKIPKETTSTTVEGTIN